MGGQNISFYAGDTRQLVVTVQNSAGQVVNLTGAQLIRYVLFQNGTVLITKTTQNGGIVITNPTGGQFTVYLTTNDTQGLNGQYQHEARLIDSAGNSSIIMTGTVTVSPSFA